MPIRQRTEKKHGAVEVIEPCTFSGLNIETIKIPSEVTQIHAYTFLECGQLKKVILPDKLKKVDPLAFNRCPKLKTLKLFPKNKASKIKTMRRIKYFRKTANAFTGKKTKALLSELLTQTLICILYQIRQMFILPE